MLLLHIVELIPAALGYLVAGIFLAVGSLVVVARVRRSLFGSTLAENGPASLRPFLKNFD
jgi:hypothetical protein